MLKIISIDPGKYKCGLVLAEINKKKVYKATIIKSELVQDSDAGYSIDYGNMPVADTYLLYTSPSPRD